MKKIVLAIIIILSLGLHLRAGEAENLRAKNPEPSEFGFGLAVEAEPGGAFYEIRLPEAVYRRITREDFGDIRVFNADKEVVPHILIHDEKKKAETRPPADLPVFPIFETTRREIRAERISARVSEDGALIEIDGPGEQSEEMVITGYVLDASGLDFKPDRLKLRITGENHDYMFPLSVWSGEDLTHWTLAASNLGVANLTFGGKALSNTLLKSDGFVGKYLKIPWPPEAKGCVLSGVQALFPENLADEKRQITVLDDGRSDESGGVLFESPGLFPVDRVGLVFPHENSMAVARIRCKNGSDDNWHAFPEALFYRLEAGGTRLIGDPMEIPVSPRRHWRVSLDGQGAGAGNDIPRLRLGWRPHRLIFVARGGAPFLLAFGSLRVEHPGDEMRMLMEPLLGLNRTSSSEYLVKQAQLGDRPIVLGGDAVLSKPKPGTDWKKYTLYGGLLICLSAVGGMAWKLAKEMEPEDDFP